jgi:hypothetical protein
MGSEVTAEQPQLPPEEEPRISTPSHEDQLIDMVKNVLNDNPNFMKNCENGIPWGIIIQDIKDILPEDEIGRDEKAKKMVKPVLCKLFGDETIGWHKDYKVASNGKKMLFVYAHAKQ